MEGLVPHQMTPPLHLLQVGVWSAISSYTEAADAECDEGNPSSLSALCCTSSALNALLTSELYYQARVADTICELNRLDPRRSSVGEKEKADIARSSAHSFYEEATRYPSAESVGGNRNLLKIVAEYAPLQGWYKLCGACDSRPWELLVRMKFSDGKFCGDVVSATGDGAWGEADLRATASATKDPVLEISFGRNGRRHCRVIGKTAEGFGVKVKRGGDPRPADCRPRDFYRSRRMRPPLPGDNRLTLQVYDVLKDLNDSVSDSWTPSPRAATHRTPSAAIERMLEHQIPLCGLRLLFRRSPSTRRFESYYPNELHFEHICGPGGTPSAMGGD